MKIALKKLARRTPCENIGVVQWTKALPFYLNSRGLLIHRIEAVTTYTYRRSGRRHNAVIYLCGNSTTSEGEFLSEPPAGRLVCQSCELMAKRKRKPSADQLVGHHVHVGRIRAERACCCEQIEAN